MSNRIDPTAPPSTNPAPPSPTGTPVVPPTAVPYLLAVVTVAAAVASLPALGVTLLPVVVVQGATVVATVLGALLGIASPGLRR